MAFDPGTFFAPSGNELYSSMLLLGSLQTGQSISYSRLPHPSQPCSARCFRSIASFSSASLAPWSCGSHCAQHSPSSPCPHVRHLPVTYHDPSDLVVLE